MFKLFTRSISPLFGKTSYNNIRFMTSSFQKYKITYQQKVIPFVKKLTDKYPIYELTFIFTFVTIAIPIMIILLYISFLYVHLIIGKIDRWFYKR